jgi:hypothetical protein
MMSVFEARRIAAELIGIKAKGHRELCPGSGHCRPGHRHAAAVAA